MIWYPSNSTEGNYCPTWYTTRYKISYKKRMYIYKKVSGEGGYGVGDT